MVSGGASTSQGNSTDEILPDTWNLFDVGQFLRINECATYCETFFQHSVDGKRLLELTNDEIIKIIKVVGPALKVVNIIDKLKEKISKMKSSQRFSTGKTKKNS